ncbi:YtxH domain-containing protein [Wukongibacter baidiensis]|uniref:YtxH domain-containing protein n=1 Tax=Wukongibacter baidiensis TaxID=1723361 RepID=UPI003D7FDC72
MNNNRFMTGVITGSVLGITAGMYALNRSTPRQRRRMMRRGAKMARNATRVIDAMDMFR